VEDLIGDTDNIYYEPEEIKIDDHNSESEDEMDRTDEEYVKTEDENF